MFQNNTRFHLYGGNHVHFFWDFGHMIHASCSVIGRNTIALWHHLWPISNILHGEVWGQGILSPFDNNEVGSFSSKIETWNDPNTAYISPKI